MASQSLPRSWTVGLALLYVGIFGYYLIVLRQLILGLVVATLVTGFGYLAVQAWWGMASDDQYQRERDDASVAREQRDTAEEDPVEILRRRYAEGKLSDREFEEKLERLLEAEEKTGGGEGLEDLTVTDRDRETE